MNKVQNQEKEKLSPGKMLRDAATLAIALVRAHAGDLTGLVVEGAKHAKWIVAAVGALLMIPVLVISLIMSVPAAAFLAETLPEWGDMGEDDGGSGSGGPVEQSPEGNFVISKVVRGYAWLSQGYHGTGTGAGIDIAAAHGTPVIALFDGKVDYYLWKNRDGALVSFGAVAFLKTKNTTAIYAHLSGFNTKESRDLIAGLPSVQTFAPDTREYQYSISVRQGDVIGYVGDTGYSFGNHLHFGILINGRPVNPLTVTIEE